MAMLWFSTWYLVKALTNRLMERDYKGRVLETHVRDMVPRYEYLDR